MAKWTTSSPNTWVRPLSSTERSMRFYVDPASHGGREHYAQFAALTLSLQGSQESILQALKTSWKALRFQQPAIALAMQGDQAVYVSPTEAELESWVSHTFFVREEDVEQAAANLPPPVLPQLHYFPSASAIALRASHVRFDFTGLLMVLNQYLELLAKVPADLKWGEEVARLYDALDSALEIPDEAPAASKAYLDEMYLTSYASAPNSGLPISGDFAKGLGRTKRLEAVLDAGSTAALVAAAKTNHFTVTTAVHAALALATTDLVAPEHKSLAQTVPVPKDLRRLVAAPFSGDEYAVNNGITGQILTVETKDATFLSTAGSITEQYKRIPNVAQVAATREFGRRAGPWTMRPPPAGLPLMSPVMLSSLGVLDRWISRNYGSGDSSLAVRDVQLRAEIAFPQVTMWLYTWNGQMRLVPCYNEAHFAFDTVERLLELTVRHLGEGLGLVLNRA